SRRALIIGAKNLSVGDYSRIDAFCVVSAGSGGISIGAYVHIGAYASLQGSGAITIEDFSGLSSRVSIYSSNEDYSGAGLTNPTIHENLRKTYDAPVRVCRHAIVGCGSVILPGVTIGNSAAVGALSLIRKNVEDFAIVAGNPAKKIGQRSRGHLE